MLAQPLADRLHLQSYDEKDSIFIRMAKSAEFLPRSRSGNTYYNIHGMLSIQQLRGCLQLGDCTNLQDARSLLHNSFQIALCEHAGKHCQFARHRIILWLVVVRRQCVQSFLLAPRKGWQKIWSRFRGVQTDLLCTERLCGPSKGPLSMLVCV